MCSSSGEITVSMQNWYLSLCMGGVASGLLVGVKIQPVNHVLIIRRNYCIYATLVFVTLYGWRGVWSTGWSENSTSQPCAHHQEKLLYLCDTGICHSVWVAWRLVYWLE